MLFEVRKSPAGLSSHQSSPSRLRRLRCLRDGAAALGDRLDGGGLGTRLGCWGEGWFHRVPRTVEGLL